MIYAKDICDNIVTQGLTILDKTPTYTFTRQVNTINALQYMYSCDVIRNRVALVQNIGGVSSANLDTYRYPITVTTQNPTGGADNVQIITITNSSNASTQDALIPYYPGYSYNVTFSVVDSCGNTGVDTVIVNNTNTTFGKGYALSQAVSGCSKFIKFDDWVKFYGDTTIEIVSAPAGFNASNFNSNFTPGSNTAVFPMSGVTNSPGVITIGSESNSLPNGNYQIKVTNCGVDIIKTITIGTGLPTYFVVNSASCSSQTKGGTRLRIGTEDGVASKIVIAKVISAPQEFINEFGPLPYDVSSYIGNGDNQEGELFLYEVPQGTYRFELTSECGDVVNTANRVINGKNINSKVDVFLNCGSFNVKVSANSAMISENFWLQKYNPATNTWGHPTTGVTYNRNSQISTTTALGIGGTGTVTGLGPTTETREINNLQQYGKFRVVAMHRVWKPIGGINYERGFCLEVLEEFDVPQNGVILDNYSVGLCGDGSRQLIIDANGVEPLEYRIIEFEGTAQTNAYQSSPIFSGLESGKYLAEVKDGCGNVSVFEFKTTVAKDPVLVPNNFCQGSVATLTLRGVPALPIQWYKDNNLIAGATSNVLTIANYNSSTNSGIYKAVINTTENLCIPTEYFFTIPTNQSTPEAGTGQTVYVVQANAGAMNLYNYITGPYDNYGTFVDINDTGYLTEELFDASYLPVGTYQFDYIVNGLCTETDQTRITINIIDTGLTAVKDIVENICPFKGTDNLINVLTNDVFADDLGVNPLNPSEYTVTTEEVDSMSILSMDANGNISVAANAQPGVTYTMKYRVTSIAASTNYKIGEVEVSTKVDNVTPTFIETLPTDITVSCNAIPTAPIITATDNCDDDVEIIYTEVINEGSCANEYQLVRTWTAMDNCGNSTSHTQTVQVIDTTAPTFVGTMPAAEIYIRCEDFKGAEVLTATDTCGEVTVESFDERVDSDCVAKYDIIRTWVATDACGNETTYTQTIHLSCPMEVFNAVTPNGDGFNDELVLNGIECYPGNSVEIYNRWGVLVYETKEYNSNGNTFKGISEGRVNIKGDNKLPTGTYYYSIKYTFDLGNGVTYPTEQTGYLHLENN